MFRFISFLFVSLFFVGQAHAMDLRSVVLVEDYSDEPVLNHFPCSLYMGVLLCSRTLALEPGCEKTFKMQGDTLSCQSLSGDQVEFGQVARDRSIADSTWNGARGYHIQFSPRVRLVKFTTPNGQVEYQVVVD